LAPPLGGFRILARASPHHRMLQPQQRRRSARELYVGLYQLLPLSITQGQDRGLMNRAEVSQARFNELTDPARRLSTDARVQIFMDQWVLSWPSYEA
jgi:hypothetical protein